MRAPAQGVPVDGADAALNAMVEEMAERLQAGDPVDLEAIARHDPERVAMLRRLRPAIEMMADLGRSLIRDSTCTGSNAAEPGHLGVLGDYRLVREIGRGSMGFVYEAEQVALGRRVALKVLPFAAAVDPKLLARFHIEAEAAAQLQHPNIVPIYSVGCENGLNYYAMQYVDGPSLAAVIRGLRRRTRTGPPERSPAASDRAVDLAGDMVSGRFAPPRPTAAVSDEASRDYHDQQAGPRAGGPATSRSSPGWAYYRAVAHLGVQASEALDYAHRTGVVHRDIKPGNLLVDTHGNLWVTDFGLARMSGQSDLTITGDLVGTLRFMSPEQAYAKRIVVDDRTDIYSLGVTLYESLTLERAFDGRDRKEVLRQIAFEEPRSPRRIDPAIPSDLETIVLKAMTKDPNGRYATASDLASDLRRFLEDRPIQARRPGLVERLEKWTRRHRAFAATSLLVLLVAVLGLSATTVLIARAGARAAAAEEKAEARASLQDSLLQQQQRILLTSHRAGWSDEAWDLIRRTTRQRLGRRDALQGWAAVGLLGLDARSAKRFREFGAESLAFDREGRRLFMGGVSEASDDKKLIGSRLWHRATLELQDLTVAGRGPVGFRRDGTPVQLVAGDTKTPLSLIDLAHREVLYRFDLPGALMEPESPTIGMTSDGSLIGAAVRGKDGRPLLLVWDGSTGKLLHQFEKEVRSLAFAPDRSLVAGGDDRGLVNVWSISDGSVVARLPSDPTIIHCLPFTDPRRRREGSGRTSWLLAAGDSGGTVRVWDVDAGRPRTFCRGAHFDVYAVAFSPDGTIMASAGRGPVKLWDTAIGRPLLDIQYSGEFLVGLAFSPDGRQLAVGSPRGFVDGFVQVWDLERGRGIREHRGLSGQVTKAVLSPDGRLLAALSQDWQVAVFDLEGGRLRLRLDAPKGLTADNSGLAFSPDGRRFALAAGREARLWDAETGAELRRWSLPDGLIDTLAFCGPDRLSLVRVETDDGQAPPFGNDPGQHPRVCVLRDLLREHAIEPIRRIRDFSRGVFGIAMACGGTHFVVEGLAGPAGPGHQVNAYDGPSGAALWSQPTRRTARSSALRIDPTGTVMSLVDSDDNSRSILVGLPARTSLGSLPGLPVALGPDAGLWLTQTPGDAQDPARVAICARARPRPLLQIVQDRGVSSPVFSPDGGRLVWCTDDGAIVDCDLNEVRRRLAEVGLEW